MYEIEEKFGSVELERQHIEGTIYSDMDLAVPIR